MASKSKNKKKRKGNVAIDAAAIRNETEPEKRPADIAQENRQPAQLPATGVPRHKTALWVSAILLALWISYLMYVAWLTNG